MKWTIYKAAQEFDIHRETLGKRLSTAAIAPDEDGKYSTLQIAQAIYGDSEGNQNLLTIERRRKLKIANDRDERKLVAIEQVMGLWARIVTEYRDRVLMSNLAPAVRSHLLEPLEQPKIEEYFAQVLEETEPEEESVDA